MNIFDDYKNIVQKHMGKPDHQYGDLCFAEFGAEHTEFMRQHEFDLLLPYMYAGWTGLRGNNWRDDYPTPMAAALHSAMAPVIVSMDIWNRNYRAGDTIAVPCHLINDLYKQVNCNVDFYITESNPVFVPDKDSLSNPLYRKSITLSMEPLSHKVDTFHIPLPDKQRICFLSVVTNRKGDQPVTSQRVIRTIKIKGEIVFSQLLIKDHINSTSVFYDPVAEQIMHNILGQ